MQMLASAEMMMMNTKDYSYSYCTKGLSQIFFTVLGHWNKETKKERKKETNKLGET